MPDIVIIMKGPTEPHALAEKLVLPQTGSLALAGQVPTSVLTGNVIVQPNAGELAIAGLQPVAVIPGDVLVQPAAGALALTGYAPSSSSAEYVSPYDNLTQRYATPTGAGAHNGTNIANAWSLEEAGDNASPGTRIRLQPATYQIQSLGMQNWEPANQGTGPHITERIILTPEPGSAEYSVIIDAESVRWLQDKIDWWMFDGEESRFDFINGGQFFDYDSAGTGGASIGFQAYNFRMDAEGTGGGGANYAPIQLSGSTLGATWLTKFGNFKITRNADGVSNDALVQVFKLHDFEMEDFELRHQGNGSVAAFYFKHAPTEEGWNKHHHKMVRGLSTGVNTGGNGTTVDQMARCTWRDMLMRGFSNTEGGPTHQNFHKFLNCTWQVHRNMGAHEGGSDPFPGMHEPTIRECIYNVSGPGWNSATPDMAPDMDWNLYNNNVTYEGSSLNLSQLQSQLGGDANSFMEEVVLVGEASQDHLVIDNWALASGNGVGGGPMGDDIGAHVANVGMKSIQEYKPAIYEQFYKSPVNQRSDSNFYDGFAFLVGTHPRHSRGCYEFPWLTGETNTGSHPISSNEPALRHKFDNSDEFTLEFYFWVTSDGAGYADHTHLFYVKGSDNSDYQAPTTGMTIYFEPRSTSGVPGDPGHMFCDFRDANGSWREMRGDQAGNLATDTDVDVYDELIHEVRCYCKANTVGQANGELRIYVDNKLTVGFDDVEWMTIAGQKFNQLLLGPYLDGNASANQSVFIADMRLWRKYW